MSFFMLIFLGYSLEWKSLLDHIAFSIGELDYALKLATLVYDYKAMKLVIL